MQMTQANIYSEESTAVEAFFEGAQNVYSGAPVNFSSSKIVLLEKLEQRLNMIIQMLTWLQKTSKNIIDDLSRSFYTY